MEDASIKNFIATALQRFRMAYQVLINPAYVGGNIKTDDVLSGTAGTEESYSLMPFTCRYPQASAQGLMIPYGNDKVAAGRMESLHLGLPASGAYWFMPVEYPTTETTITTGGAALRQRCPGSVYVTRAQIEVTTLQANSTGLVKIYSSDGVLLWTSGNLATTSNTFITSDATNPGVWLNGGYTYIVQYTNDNAAVAVRAVALSTTADNHLNQTVVQRAISAANIVANSAANTPEFPRIKLF